MKPPNLARPLKVKILTQEGDFAALGTEWEDLYHNCPVATPFQSWAWLFSWWESFGGNFELRLVTFRDEDLLVGIMPLMLDSLWGNLSRLLFIGNGPSDHLDVLAREGWETPVTAAAVSALREMHSWHVADLQEVRPEAVVWRILREWPGHHTHAWQSGCPVIDVKPWEEMLVPLSKNLRSTVRRAIRRAERDGVICELAGVEDVERAARRCVELHREMWQGRDIAPEHLTEKFESHIVAAASRMTVRGLGGISEFRRGRDVIASHLLLFGHGFVGEHLLGANQEAIQRYQVSSLNVWDAVNVARSTNSARVSLLRGEEPYKLRWSSEVVPNHRVVLSRTPAFARLYLAYLSLRSNAKRYANSEDTSSWIKNAVYRLKRRS